MRVLNIRLGCVMCVGGEEVFVVHGSCVGLVLVSTGWFGLVLL